MADLFTVTAPLLLRTRDGAAQVAIASYPHPEGVICVLVAGSGGLEVSLLQGELRGDGPWKIDNTVITVLGCQGSHPEQAALYAAWRARCEAESGGCPGRGTLRQLVCRAGFAV